MDKNDKSGLFHFDKNPGKKGSKIDSKREKRRQAFMKDHNAEDLKRKREDRNVALRKEAKQAKFNKRRRLNMGNGEDLKTEEEEKKIADEELYTFDETANAFHEGMDLMEYFKMLTKTDFQLPHFLQLHDLIMAREDHKILFGIVGIRKLLSFIENPPIQSVIDANMLPILLALVTRVDFPRLQFEALW